MKANTWMKDDKVHLEIEGHTVSFPDDEKGWTQFRNVLLQRSIAEGATIGMEASPIQDMIDKSRDAVQAFTEQQLRERRNAEAALAALGL